MAINLIKKIKKVLVNGTEVPLNLPNIQASKSVTVSGTQEILPDSGFDALAKVIATEGGGAGNQAAGEIVLNSGRTSYTFSGLSFQPKFVYLNGIDSSSNGGHIMTDLFAIDFGDYGVYCQGYAYYSTYGSFSSIHTKSESDPFLNLTNNGFVYDGANAYDQGLGTPTMIGAYGWFATDYDIGYYWE